MTRKLSAAFSKWREFTTDWCHAGSQALAAMRMMHDRTTRRALNAWRVEVSVGIALESQTSARAARFLFDKSRLAQVFAVGLWRDVCHCEGITAGLVIAHMSIYGNNH